MKFVCTADLHIKVPADVEYTEQGLPLKLIEILNTIQQMCDYCRTNYIKDIFILGDVNDLKNIVHYRAFVLLKQLIEKNKDINFTIISGNHDEAFKQDLLSSIQLLDGPSNVRTIVNETTVIDNITLIPWCSDLPDKIKLAEPSNVMVSHLGLSEAKFNSGLSITTNVKLSDLKKFKVVILGHYHLPQEVGNVYYVGSPIQHNKGEATDEKRFLVVDSITAEVQSIPTTGYRKYYEFLIDEDTDVKKLTKEINKLKEEKHFVYVRNTVKGINLVGLPDIPVIMDFETDTQKRGITSGMPLVDQCKKYLEIMEIPEDESTFYINVLTEAIK